MFALSRLAALAVALVFIASGTAARSAPFTAEEAAQVDDIVARALREVRTPSASVAIVRDGEIAFTKAYGLRRVEVPEPSTVDTRYRVASISKQFTAAAVLMLADEGRLSLDEPLSRYLPELHPSDLRTIRQALSHTAGFPDFWSVEFVTAQLATPTSPRAIVEQWGNTSPSFLPGSRWAYSNTGYVVLGHLVERVSGQPLGTFLRKRIFEPLKMTSAADVDGIGALEGDAHGYTRTAIGPARETVGVAAGWTFGCGGLSMTASDLARWDVSILRQRLMSQAAYTAIATETKMPDGTGTGYGLGTFVDRVNGRRRLRHNGDLPGFWSENRIYPDDDAAVVVMVNGSYGGSPHAVIANGIERMLMPAAVPTPAPVRLSSPEQALGMIIRQIRNDQLDRSQLSPAASAYLSGEVLADYRESFRRLGPSLASVALGESVEDGTKVGRWVLVWPEVKLMVVVRLGSNDKVDGFFAYPVWLSEDEA